LLDITDALKLNKSIGSGIIISSGMRFDTPLVLAEIDRVALLASKNMSISTRPKSQAERERWDQPN
jgi:hypothetical protein